MNRATSVLVFGALNNDGIPYFCPVIPYDLLSNIYDERVRSHVKSAGIPSLAAHPKSRRLIAVVHRIRFHVPLKLTALYTWHHRCYLYAVDVYKARRDYHRVDPRVAFGRRVRRVRDRLGISQEELAARSGCHRTFVGERLNGKNPQANVLTPIDGATASPLTHGRNGGHFDPPEYTCGPTSRTLTTLFIRCSVKQVTNQ